MFCDLRPENVVFPLMSLDFIFLQSTFWCWLTGFCLMVCGLWFVLLLLIFLTFDSFKMRGLEFIRHKYIATGGPTRVSALCAIPVEV